MRLGELIKKYREENEISQREFARRCELSNSLISIIEMGVNPQTGKRMSPDLETYRKIANGMGISIQQLLEQIEITESIDITKLPWEMPVAGDVFDSYMTAVVPDHVTPNNEERLLISKWRLADKNIKAAIRKLLDMD